VIRDVCRGRTDATNEEKRTKQQLKSFMLRNGYRYEGTANLLLMRLIDEQYMKHPEFGSSRMTDWLHNTT
jgi:SOS response regulatory protein OraA/RecX